MKRICLGLFGILLISSVFAQKNNKKESDTLFHSPINETVQFSGSFAELRATHLHGGADIRTNAQEGKVIKAAMGGYVSQIQVDIGGYGKNIHIKHPNGYTTIYGHLREFSPKLAKYVRKEQEKQASYTINLFPAKNQFKVKAGQQIAWSGNTGHSGGPHLHFEIRNPKGEVQVNPLHYGIPIDDKFPPVFEGLAIYPESNDLYELAEGSPMYFKAKKKDQSYTLADTMLKEIPRYFSIGISAWDKPGVNQNHNGVYSYQVFIDGEKEFHLNMDAVPLKEVDDYYAILDYPRFEKTGEHFMKTRKEPNSQVSFYKYNHNDGLFALADTNVHRVLVIVKDYAGNTAELKFSVKAKCEAFKDFISAEVAFDDSCFLKLGKLSLDIPENGLYKTSLIRVKKIAQEPGGKFVHYLLGGRNIMPAAKAFTIRYILPDSLKPIKKQLCWVRKNARARESWVKTDWDGDTLIAQSRFFGDYLLKIDSLAPEISLMGTKNIKHQKGDTLKFKVKDKLSGIDHYEASLNGKWILLEYEPKLDLMFYKIERTWRRRENRIKLKVVDRQGNEKRHEEYFKKI